MAEIVNYVGGNFAAGETVGVMMHGRQKALVEGGAGGFIAAVSPHPEVDGG